MEIGDRTTILCLLVERVSSRSSCAVGLVFVAQAAMELLKSHRSNIDPSMNHGVRVKWLRLLWQLSNLLCCMP
eukprot:1747934-Amphidinium_carterae.1